MQWCGVFATYILPHLEEEVNLGRFTVTGISKSWSLVQDLGLSVRARPLCWEHASYKYTPINHCRRLCKKIFPWSFMYDPPMNTPLCNSVAQLSNLFSVVSTDVEQSNSYKFCIWIAYNLPYMQPMQGSCCDQELYGLEQCNHLHIYNVPFQKYFQFSYLHWDALLNCF